ncbi:hypothetical protein LOD99_1749 [Oopsacas minuta]|uniref:HAT C-terminal dimerisation domain-containing protein n=1 Tax=Oopsacas minuta TaxID=111878 RepID=A0AAV7K5E3_9METZ|nr:hypothetical protein LOD99_1749 [Oopsacas minuta]
MDCCMKILPGVFPDSKIAKKIHCGRTKSEALIANVLCPHSIEVVTNELNIPKNIFYLISTDASNKGNLKHYPLAVRYFSKSFGTKNRVIDFYVCSEETSDSISSNILTRLEHNQMNIQYLVYFLQLGEDECPTFIWDFIKDQEHGLNEEDELSMNECFLYFVHSFMNVFQESIKKLEDSTTQSPEVYNIMCRLRSNFKDRLRDGFYGFKVNQCLPKLQAREQVRFKDEANRVFQRIISYLDKWFDYEGSIYKHIQILNLNREEITFDDLTKIASHFQIKINGDDMYNEFCWLREWRVKQRKNLLPIDEQWVAFFSYANSPNLLSLVEFALALPVSNAYVERIFSLMKNLWTDERNRLSTEMVKAELCVKLNYSLSCKDFYNFIRQEKRLLKIAKSSDKYFSK